jgi:multidrug efflux system membrane fusion protein
LIRTTDGRREITEGLNPGERVIVNGLQLVRPGVAVEPNLVDMPDSRARKSNGTAFLAKAAAGR